MNSKELPMCECKPVSTFSRRHRRPNPPQRLGGGEESHGEGVRICPPAWPHCGHAHSRGTHDSHGQTQDGSKPASFRTSTHSWSATQRVRAAQV